jgi:hypothetical protein
LDSQGSLRLNEWGNDLLLSSSSLLNPAGMDSGKLNQWDSVYGLGGNDQLSSASHHRSFFGGNDATNTSSNPILPATPGLIPNASVRSPPGLIPSSSLNAASQTSAHTASTNRTMIVASMPPPGLGLGLSNSSGNNPVPSQQSEEKTLTPSATVTGSGSSGSNSFLSYLKSGGGGGKT